MKYIFILTLLTVAFSLPASAQIYQKGEKSKTENVLLQFSHVVGERNLQLDSSYENSHGEIYSVRKFRYYVSNLIFHDTANGVEHFVADSYFLVNEAVVESKSIALVIPTGKYNAVSFLLGVDSVKNITGAQTGSLDPLNDMFWTWNTGYVMMKLEGVSPLSKLPRRIIEYHIGGFKAPHNVLRRFFLPLSEKVVSSNSIMTVQIQANVNNLFMGKHNLKITDSPACTSVGFLATQFADNYQDMFSIRER